MYKNIKLYILKISESFTAIIITHNKMLIYFCSRSSLQKILNRKSRFFVLHSKIKCLNKSLFDNPLKAKKISLG